MARGTGDRAGDWFTDYGKPTGEPEDPRTRLTRLLADQLRGATNDQCTSVRRWQSKDDRFYQQVQRAAVGQSAIPEALTVAEDLEDLMTPLSLAVEVWRGARNAEKAFGIAPDRLEELVGRAYELSAFLATSLDKKIAETEFTRPGRRPALYRIRAVIGTPALWIPPLGSPENAYQQELLFPPGIVLRILGVVRSSEIPVVDVEVSSGQVG